MRSELFKNAVLSVYRELNEGIELLLERRQYPGMLPGYAEFKTFLKEEHKYV